MTVTSPSGECKAHQLFILNLQCQWITLWPHLKGMCNLIHLFYYSTIRKVNRKLDGKLRGVLCELRQGVLARLVRWAAISREAWTYLKQFAIIDFIKTFPQLRYLYDKLRIHCVFKLLFEYTNYVRVLKLLIL